MSFVGVAVELRKSRRYRLLARACFFWERSDALLQEGKGTTRDISDRGMFVEGNVAPPLGARLDVDIYLPPLEAGSGATQLHGEGVVVRVDREAGGAKGFAATMAFHAETANESTVVSRKKLH